MSDEAKPANAGPRSTEQRYPGRRRDAPRCGAKTGRGQPACARHSAMAAAPTTGASARVPRQPRVGHGSLQATLGEMAQGPRSAPGIDVRRRPTRPSSANYTPHPGVRALSVVSAEHNRKTRARA